MTDADEDSEDFLGVSNETDLVADMVIDGWKRFSLRKLGECA